MKSILQSHRSVALFVAAAAVLALAACERAAPAPGAQPGATDPVAQVPANAPAGTIPDKVKAALQVIAPSVAPDKIEAAPLSGFQQAVIQGRLVYVSNDGQYLLEGRLFDITTKRDLSELAMVSVRRGILHSIPVEDRIVFAPAKPKYTVTVFTDIECGYCRKFHADIDAYNAAGIAVQYLAFPRGGIGSPSYERMVRVWCSADRRKALTDAKADVPLAASTCDNPVVAEFNAGLKAGLQGTPMIVAEDGTTIGGYLAPQALREALDAHAATTTVHNKS